MLRYFYVVDQAELLFQLLGEPLLVPRVVYDPDEEPALPERAMSELTRSIHVQRMRASDVRREPAERDAAEAHARRLACITQHHSTGRIEVADLTEPEREVFAQLASRGDSLRTGLKFPLDPGEAACVAVAVQRKLVLATDDGDGLKAYRALRPLGPYERIRRLLRRAAGSGIIDEAEANAIHKSMRDAGFWDAGQPFPM